MEPYRQSSFDFGDPGFQERLEACFKEASTLRQAAGSPHFIFLIKALVGLLNLLVQLKPQIDTTDSIERLNAALEDIDGRPVSA